MTEQQQPALPAPLQPGLFANLRYDAPAGLVVFLVALPLCLGIALASDAPLLGGIISGVVAGLVVAPLSKSQLSVSGPAAGLAVIVAAGIAELGSYQAFLLAVVISGAFQILAGIVRAGALANLFPISVIKGMLAGIGIILVLKQLPHALGRDADFEGDESFWLAGHQATTFSEIGAAIRYPTPGIVIISLSCLALLLLWERPFIARQAWAKVIPGPLVAVGAGIALNALFGYVAPTWHILPGNGHLVELPTFGSISDLSAAVVMPDFTSITNPAVWRVAAVIAAIGSLETLLSVEAIDKLDPWRRTTPTNRELLAQGAGNMVAGMVGGIPITAVIVRSSANLYSGGRTRLSAIIHGLLLAVLALSVPGLLNLVPLSALAAVLLMVGYKLAKFDLFRSMYRKGASQFVPFIVTAAATVLSDLLIGVTLGFAVGVLFVIYTNYRSSITLVQDGDAYLIKFAKDVSFLNKTRLRGLLESIPDGADVCFEGERAEFIDHDILEQVQTFTDAAPYRQIRVELRAIANKDRLIHHGAS